MPKIRVQDVDLYYEFHGPEHDEVLVLSNGILMSTASWAFQTPVLSRHYRLLLYDCRGMWQSDHPPGPYTMEQHADDLAGLLDGLGIERAHIGGISYGGEISLTFALRHPERTSSLIVADAVSHVDPWLRAVVQGWIAAAKTKDPQTFFNATVPWNFSPQFVREHPDLMAQALDRWRKGLDPRPLLKEALKAGRTLPNPYVYHLALSTLSLYLWPQSPRKAKALSQHLLYHTHKTGFAVHLELARLLRAQLLLEEGEGVGHLLGFTPSLPFLQAWRAYLLRASGSGGWEERVDPKLRGYGILGEWVRRLWGRGRPVWTWPKR